MKTTPLAIQNPVGGGDAAVSAAEKLLVKRLKAGDMDAFELLYQKYIGKVWNFVHTLLQDKSLADDISQNVFMKLWEKREYLNEERKLSAYIFTIAKHFVYKQTEKMVLHGKYIAATQTRLTLLDNSSIEELDARFMTNYINDILVQLPASRREIFVMSKLQGLSNKEIAQRLGIAEKTVETQLYRANNFVKKFKR